MKKYSYRVGTPDAMNTQSTKLLDKKSNPRHVKYQNILERMKSYYRGDTNNYEWQ